MKTVIYGINGKMGSLLSEYIQKDSRFELICGIDSFVNKQNPNVLTLTSLEQSAVPEVIIDFSHPSQINTILDYALNYQVALVIATTGYGEQEIQMIHQAAKQIPIFYSANMSFGIHVIRQILKLATNMLEDYDIEIIEKHHRHKIDAPSGTANLLALTIQDSSKIDYKFLHGRSGEAGKRTNTEIGIHALRGGTIVGEHTVVFAAEDEVIEITHQAQSKAVFVHGAMKAALFITNQAPGLYTMDDLTRKN